MDSGVSCSPVTLSEPFEGFHDVGISDIRFSHWEKQRQHFVCVV